MLKSCRSCSTVCLLLLLTGLVDGHGTGAGVEACVSMIPGHSTAAQNSPPPYQLTAIQEATGFIKVTLKATEPAYFIKGFLLKAVKAHMDSPSTEQVGTFVILPETTKRMCEDPATESSAVSHSQPLNSRELTFIYKSSEDAPYFYFEATVNHDLTTYWTGIRSAIVVATVPGEEPDPTASGTQEEAMVNRTVTDTSSAVMSSANTVLILLLNIVILHRIAS